MNDALIDGLAVFRITRLAVEDTILDRPRDKLVARLQLADHPKLIELVGCPWCVSVYAATAVVIARKVAPRAWAPVARMLAFSAVAGLLSER